MINPLENCKSVDRCFALTRKIENAFEGYSDRECCHALRNIFLANADIIAKEMNIPEKDIYAFFDCG